MYIEFSLPTGAGGMGALMVRGEIQKDLVQWVAKHNIPYSTKTVKYTFRVAFNDDANCEFFVLSFQSNRPFRVVDPLNNLT